MSLSQQHFDTYTDYPVDQIPALRDNLHKIHLEQKCRPYAYRMHYLKQVGYLIQDNAKLICDAVHADLGRSDAETNFGEVWTSVREADLAVKRLKEWMKEEHNGRDTILAFKTNNPRVKKQPKGVVLAIGPWNYPFYLNFGPLIGAIAAGCPIVIKPSEHSKHSSLLLSQLVHKYLDNETHHVVLGAVDSSSALLGLDWGHVFFTGSTHIGRIVAESCAKRLVPCTLELGGKSPVIITRSANLKVSARRILSIKALGTGQMCTNADYILCPSDMVDELMKVCAEVLEEFYPNNSATDSPHLSQMIHKPAYNRINKFIDQAKSEGHQIVGGQTDAGKRKIGLTCIRMKGEDSEAGWMKEEIFGPILPIVPIKDIDAAINYVNARPNPLALYVFASHRKEFDYVVDHTLSGGACWNDISIQTIQRSLPFGGVGHSGWGSGHGKAAFETFSHRRALIDVPFNTELLMKLRYPSAPAWGNKLLGLIIGHKLSFSRSASVEAEARRLGRGKAFKKIMTILFGVAVILAYRARK